MTEGETLHAVLRALGRLEGKVSAVDEKFEVIAEGLKEDRDATRLSRARLHERLDEHSKLIGAVQSEIRVAAGVDTQVRNELDGMAKAVHASKIETTEAIGKVAAETATAIETMRNEIEPTIRTVRTLKLAGAGAGGAFALLGVTAATAGEWTINAVRSLLRIS